MGQFGYRYIADHFRNAINRGDYPPGTTLPSQEDIANRYGVNRATVRRAISTLHAEGLLDPRPAVGTVVRDREKLRLTIKRYQQKDTRLGPFEAACAEQGLLGKTEATGVSWVQASIIVARDLEINEHDRVCQRKSVHRVDGHVLQIQTSWFPEHVAIGENNPINKPKGIAGGLYHGLAIAGFSPVRFRETVGARMPTQDEAELMRLRLGSPVLTSRRVGIDKNNTAVIVTHSAFNGDEMEMVFIQEL